MKDQLPKNWKWVKLGDVCIKMSNGANVKQYDDKIGLPISRIETIWNQTIDLNRVKYIQENNESFIEKYSLRKDDILFSHINSDIHLGKTAIFKNQKIILIHGINLLLIRLSSDALPDFFNYQFINKRRRGEFISIAQKSVNQSSINQPKLKNLDFVLPPKPIQQAIVSKIEELFSELDKGIENLLIAQQQLKTYRQAVLKWAFEGKLTNDDLKVGQIPKGWKIQKFNEVGKWKGGGTPSKTNKEFWQNGTVLWVSPKDMKSKTIVDTIDKITINAIENSSTNLISKDSILFVVRSGILRRTLPVAVTICDVTVNQDIQAFTPVGVLPDFVYWYVQSKNEDIRRKCSKDGTTVESIESTLLRNYPISVTSGEEQQEIVNEIESRLSVVDKMEESITQSLQQAAALRQSILKKAFEGKLVVE